MLMIPSTPVVFVMSPWGMQQGQANGYNNAIACQGQGYDQLVNASWQGRQNFVGASASLMSTHGSNKSGRKQRNVNEERAPTNETTTICFQNIPNSYSRQMVFELLDENGFKGLYNFVYAPHDFKRLPALVNLGYFFVNFDSHGCALRAWEKFVGFKGWATESSKVMAATWASTTQGKAECIERFQNSPVMHEDVPPECKPVLIENGVVVHLTPTRKITKQPRFKSCYGQKLAANVSGDALEDSARQAVDDKETCIEDLSPRSISTMADDSQRSENGTAIVEATSSISTVTDSDSDAHSATDSCEFQSYFALPCTEQLFEVRNSFIDLKQPPSIERCGRRARTFTF